MARLGRYPTDENVTSTDKMLGTDTAGATKNFPLNSVADFFSKSNSIKIGGQLVYKFQPTLSDVIAGDFSVDGGNNVSMSAITAFSVHKAVDSNTSVESILSRIFDNRFRVYGVTDLNDYYDFEVTRIEDHPEISNAYKVTVVSISGNANSTFTEDEHYAFSPATGDKSYTHSQGTPSATWEITHNLGKKPSVTVQDSANNDVVGEVTYNTDQKLTITFSGAFSGTAHLN